MKMVMILAWWLVQVTTTARAHTFTKQTHVAGKPGNSKTTNTRSASKLQHAEVRSKRDGRPQRGESRLITQRTEVRYNKWLSLL